MKINSTEYFSQNSIGEAGFSSVIRLLVTFRDNNFFEEHSSDLTGSDGLYYVGWLRKEGLHTHKQTDGF
jgi:hypothetical protein